jgi:hypothetical protein
MISGMLVALFVSTCIGTASAQAEQPKRVVCITGDGSGYANNVEGYERILKQNAEKDKKQPHSSIYVGGKITTCLAKVAGGDTLVIVAHGSKGDFSWNDDKDTKKSYDSFAQVSLPNGFGKLTNVSVIFDSCYSCTGGEIAAQVCMCDSILKEMSQKKDNGNSCVGFKGVVDGSSLPRLDMKKGVKRNQDEIKAGYACIKADKSWQTFPPSNRTDTQQNQKTAAQAIVDDKKNCAGANGNLLVTNMVYGIPVESINDKLLKARACNQDPLGNQDSSTAAYDDRLAPELETAVCDLASGCPECGNAVILPIDLGEYIDGPEPSPIHVGEVATIMIHGGTADATSEERRIEAAKVYGSIRFTNGGISNNGAETTLSLDESGAWLLEFVADQPGVSLLRLTLNGQSYDIYVRAIVP